jgi:hypothetical protein
MPKTLKRVVEVAQVAPKKPLSSYFLFAADERKHINKTKTGITFRTQKLLHNNVKAI